MCLQGITRYVDRELRKRRIRLVKACGGGGIVAPQLAGHGLWWPRGRRLKGDVGEGNVLIGTDPEAV